MAKVLVARLFAKMLRAAGARGQSKVWQRVGESGPCLTTEIFGFLVRVATSFSPFGHSVIFVTCKTSPCHYSDANDFAMSQIAPLSAGKRHTRRESLAAERYN